MRCAAWQEGEVERRGTVGRPGTEVRIAPHHVAGIGLELNVDYLAVCLRDLAGQVRFTSSVPMPYILDAEAADGRAYPIAPILDLAAQQLQEALEVAAGEGLWVAGATIAPPGPIDYDGAGVRFASNVGWADVPLGEVLGRRLGPGHPVLTLENDAKLSALGRRRAWPSAASRTWSTSLRCGAQYHRCGRLIRGWSGFSGEVGHIGLTRRGAVPVRTMRLLGDHGRLRHRARRPRRGPPARSGGSRCRAARRIRTLLTRGCAAEDRFARLRKTSCAAGVLVDVLNPQAIVLGGYFGAFADRLVRPVQEALDLRLLAQDGRVEVSSSTLGLEAAAAGGAAVALERVLEDPLLAPTLAG